MTEEERHLIKEAVEANRVSKIPVGVTTLLAKTEKETRTRWDPRFCDTGDRVERQPGLDSEDDD